MPSCPSAPADSFENATFLRLQCIFTFPEDNYGKFDSDVSFLPLSVISEPCVTQVIYRSEAPLAPTGGKAQDVNTAGPEVEMIDGEEVLSSHLHFHMRHKSVRGRQRQ